MVCSICGSVGVNKSSCPLYVKNPNKENWLNHPLAKQSVKKSAKKKIKILKKIKKTIAKRYSNPYTDKMTQICNVSNRIVGQINSRFQIILTGHILKHYDIPIRNPNILRIEVTNNITNREKLIEFLNLYCDVYKRLEMLKPNRLDFFINPDSSTRQILVLRNNIKVAFIEFIIDNVNKGGGLPANIDLNGPIDDIIYAIRVTNSMPLIDDLLLPEAPSHSITKTDEIREKIAISIENEL